MSTIKRKGSKAENLCIIREAEQNGITQTMRMHILCSPYT